ncbi:YlcI/YnfO family protein [Ellagibacter isourolithinifaciens]|uniref:YlcI/YnfO family protein n=1 Tax=Eggerthellaceae TaxID=1643826 RepID=UPI003A8CF649
MDYPELIKNNASPTEIQKYLVDGEMAAITIRIPKNLRDSAKEAAALKGMSFSALVRTSLIRELSEQPGRIG